jgi:hypothetical protein
VGIITIYNSYKDLTLLSYRFLSVVSCLLLDIILLYSLIRTDSI